MGVAAARLVFLAFLGLTGSIIYNALYLQDSRLTGAVPSTHQQASANPAEAAKLPPVRTDLPQLQPNQGGSQLIVRAVQRELSARGFDVGAVDGVPSDKTRAAISTYEKANGLPVTGTASDDLLHHILLGDGAQPSGATGSVAGKPNPGKTAQSSNVKAVQQILAELGYAPGPADGEMGDATVRAITTFQHDRKIAETGRITPQLLTELGHVTGRDVSGSMER